MSNNTCCCTHHCECCCHNTDESTTTNTYVTALDTISRAAFKQQLDQLEHTRYNSYPGD